MGLCRGYVRKAAPLISGICSIILPIINEYDPVMNLAKRIRPRVRLCSRCVTPQRPWSVTGMSRRITLPDLRAQVFYQLHLKFYCAHKQLGTGCPLNQLRVVLPYLVDVG